MVAREPPKTWAQRFSAIVPQVIALAALSSYFGKWSHFANSPVINRCVFFHSGTGEKPHVPRSVAFFNSKATQHILWILLSGVHLDGLEIDAFHDTPSLRIVRNVAMAGWEGNCE